MIDAAWLPFILLLMSDTVTWRFVFGLWLLATLSGMRRRPSRSDATRQASGSVCKKSNFRQLHVTDHAVLRFLERGGVVDVSAVRRALADLLGRAAGSAEVIGGDYRIRIEHLDFVCVEDRVVTVVDTRRGGRP